MNNVNPQPASRPQQNNIEDIAGGGGGMILVSLAQNIPDDNILKSWLLILVPAFTLLLRYIWRHASAEAAFLIKEVCAYFNRRKLIRGIDSLLRDDTISELQKRKFRLERERIKLSAIEALLKHYEKNNSS